MKEKDFKLEEVTDLDLLDKTFFYLEYLCSVLSSSRLLHHCFGAMASVYELYFYLKSHNLKYYGNN